MALLEESAASFRQLGNRRREAEAVSRLAAVALRRGELGRAAALLRGSLAGLRETGARRDAAQDLELAAELAWAERRPERAARLLGAADALRRAIGLATAPADRPEHERTLAAVRVGLGPAAFAAAWRTGAAMTPEQAIEHALGDGEPPAGTPPPRPSGPLTPREREVAALIARGFSNRQIAEALTIAVGTADRHVANILGRLGFASRAKVAAWAVEQGLLAPA
jgi:non-specific serine/threonine protein kinase